MITLAEVRNILLKKLEYNDTAYRWIAKALDKPDIYAYKAIAFGNFTVVEFIYICYILNLNIKTFFSETEELNLLYDKANENVGPIQLSVEMFNQQNTTTQPSNNKILKKEYVTVSEYELLNVFRKIGEKHGTKKQYEIIELAEKML